MEAANQNACSQPTNVAMTGDEGSDPGVEWREKLADSGWWSGKR